MVLLRWTETAFVLALMSSLTPSTSSSSSSLPSSSSSSLEDAMTRNALKLSSSLSTSLSSSNVESFTMKVRQHPKKKSTKINSLVVPKDPSRRRLNAWKPTDAQVQQIRSLRASTRTRTRTRTRNADGNSLVSSPSHHQQEQREEEQQQHQQQFQRKLPLTGHIWDACSPDGNQVTEAVYKDTQYDDEHDPACECYWDQVNLEFWMQCTLGDETCDDSNSNGTNVCSGTHEIFLFADHSGDLQQKFECHWCMDENPENCVGVVETCTVVLFDDDENPVMCRLQEAKDDNTVEICDECSICTDDVTGKEGIAYNCFGESTANNTCDTTKTSAHIHNFEPVIQPGGTLPIGGTFGNLCKKDEESSLYSLTRYDDTYQKICDCNDPTDGVVVCDLFKAGANPEECFANECSEISEIFYFNAQSGEMVEKLTCDATNGLCSMVKFTDEGQPWDCFILSPANLDTCSTCSICKDDDNEAYGIKFKCFGATQDTCLTTKGRAIFNFLEQPEPEIIVDDGGSSNGSGNGANGSNTQDGDDDKNDQLPLILGAFFGGIFVASCLTVVFVKWSQRTDGSAAPGVAAGAAPAAGTTSGGATPMDGGSGLVPAQTGAAPIAESSALSPAGGVNGGTSSAGGGVEQVPSTPGAPQMAENATAAAGGVVGSGELAPNPNIDDPSKLVIT